MRTANLKITGVFDAPDDNEHKFVHYGINSAAPGTNGDTPLDGQPADNANTPHTDMRRIRSCGASLRSLGQKVAHHFDKLNASQKLNFMYMAQLTAGLSLLAGGSFFLASGAAPVLAGGLLATGTLNSARCSGQYLLRRWKAKDAASDQETEVVNSSLSALTNTPQALSGLSLAGIAAVSSYGLRVMNKARQHEDIQRRASASADADTGTNDDENNNAVKLNDVYKDNNGFVRAFSHAAAGASRKLDGIAGRDDNGNRRIDQLPALGMTGRGLLQTVEGIGIGLINPVAGVFVTGAGVLYTGAATLMRDADTNPDSQQPEQSQHNSHDQGPENRSKQNSTPKL